MCFEHATIGAVGRNGDKRHSMLHRGPARKLLDDVLAPPANGLPTRMQRAKEVGLYPKPVEPRTADLRVLAQGWRAPNQGLIIFVGGGGDMASSVS